MIAFKTWVQAKCTRGGCSRVWLFFRVFKAVCWKNIPGITSVAEHFIPALVGGFPDIAVNPALGIPILLENLNGYVKKLGA